MDRRTCLALLASAPLAIAAAGSGKPFPDRRFRDAVVIDGMGAISDPYGQPTDVKISARALSELKASGQTVCSMTVNAVGNELDSFEKSVKMIAEIDQVIADNKHAFVKISSVTDIATAKAAGQLGLVFNTQDTSLIGPELDRIALLKGLGVRIVQLTYNNRNLSGDGCLEPANAGLSKLGRATIARIEQEKLLLDLSHAGQRTVVEAIAASTRPMTISHTGCRDLPTREAWLVFIGCLSWSAGANRPVLIWCDT
jgi:membrane dipeptidase